MTEVEIQIRDALVRAAFESVRQMPGKILVQARDKMKNSDLDGAANLYILYLNCTPAEETSERKEASSFLADAFNTRHAMGLAATVE